MTRVRRGLTVLGCLVLGASVLWFALRARAPGVLVGAPDSQLRTVPRPSDALGSTLALLDVSGKAVWEVELLATYGFPQVPRVGVAALKRALTNRRLRWVVANAELDGATRSRLRAAVQSGTWLVELGPKPAVCGPAAAPERVSGKEAHYRVEGNGLRDVRWPVAVASVPGCQVSDCGSASVLARAALRGGAGKVVPLVTRQALGRGACTRWLGDLREAVQRLRQGDPRRVAAPGAQGMFKPGDLFVGDLAEPDYAIPSADRLGFALAAQIVAAPGADVLVSPLPAGSRGLALFTADQDFVPGAGVLAQSAELGAAGLTVTLTAADIGAKPDVVFRQGEPSLMAAELVAQLAERGQDVGLHPNLIELPASSYPHVLARHVEAFRRAYGVAPRMVRNHHLVWSGYAEMARLQAAVGLALNLDFVTAASITGYHAGFMTGSGLPMRFVDERGRVLPIYQQATQIDDYVFTPGQAASRQDALAQLIESTNKLLATSQREHVPVTLLHHPAWWYETHGAWQKAFLRETARLGMAVWGVGRFLTFVEGARASRVTRARVGVDVVTLVPGAALLVEGAEHWTIDGRTQETALTRSLGGTTYRELALPLGTAHVEGN
jgi:hypothetical protein